MTFSITRLSEIFHRVAVGVAVYHLTVPLSWYTPSFSKKDQLGLGRMERQLQAVEDDPNPPERLVCLCFRPAQQYGIVGIPYQLTQLATAVLPEPIQLVKHHVRQHARNHSALGYALVAGKQLPVVQHARFQPLPQQLQHS